jgi:hypothetical protein
LSLYYLLTLFHNLRDQISIVIQWSNLTLDLVYITTKFYIKYPFEKIMLNKLKNLINLIYNVILIYCISLENLNSSLKVVPINFTIKLTYNTGNQVTVSLLIFYLRNLKLNTELRNLNTLTTTPVHFLIQLENPTSLANLFASPGKEHHALGCYISYVDN